MQSTGTNCSPDQTSPHSSMSPVLGMGWGFGYLEGEGKFGSCGMTGGFLNSGGAAGSGVGLLIAMATVRRAAPPSAASVLFRSLCTLPLGGGDGAPPPPSPAIAMIAEAELAAISPPLPSL